MKRATFKTKSSGTYVMLDFNFFDGDRTLQEARHHLDVLTKALATAERWERERR